MIVFARNIEDGLYRVPVSGGEVTRVTTLNRSRGENSHRWPQFLPDGRHLLFLARSATQDHQGIYIGLPASNDWKLVLRTPFNALVTAVPRPPPAGRLFSAGHGYLVFMRDQTMMAQPFDLDQLELSGGPSPVGESVATERNRGVFSVSENSSLAYRGVARDAQRLVWFDRTGKLLETGGSPSGNSPRLSPTTSTLRSTAWIP